MNLHEAIGAGIIGAGTALVFGIAALLVRWTWAGLKYLVKGKRTKGHE
jgi:hypothetical protein